MYFNQKGREGHCKLTPKKVVKRTLSKCYWTKYAPITTTLIYWDPNTLGYCFWRYSLWTYLRLNEVVRVGLYSDRVGGIIRRGQERYFSLILWAHVRGHVSTQGDSSHLQTMKGALTRKRTLPDPDSELWENKYLLFKLPNLQFLLWQPKLTNTPRKKWGFLAKLLVSPKDQAVGRWELLP